MQIDRSAVLLLVAPPSLTSLAAEQRECSPCMCIQSVHHVYEYHSFALAFASRGLCVHMLSVHVVHSC